VSECVLKLFCGRARQISTTRTSVVCITSLTPSRVKFVNKRLAIAQSLHSLFLCSLPPTSNNKTIFGLRVCVCALVLNIWWGI
jgi:hypothetical protein